MEVEKNDYLRERKKNKTDIKINSQKDFMILNTIQSNLKDDYRKSFNFSKTNITNNNKLNTIERKDSPIKIINHKRRIDFINNDNKNPNKVLVKNFYDGMINFSLGNKKDLKKCSVKKIYIPLPIKKKLIKPCKKNIEKHSIKNTINVTKNKNSIQENFCNRNNKVAKYFLSETIQKNISMTFDNKNKASLFNGHVLNFKKNSRDILKSYLVFSEKETIKEQKFQELKFRRRMCNFGKTFEKLSKPLFKAVS